MINTDAYIEKISIELPQERNHYPFSIPAIKNFDSITLDNKVTFIVGENGSGKSTLMEAIAINIGLNPEGGNRNTRFSNLATESGLQNYITLSKTINRIKDSFFFRAETMFSLLIEAEKEKYGWGSYGWSGRHKLSHGESQFNLMLDKLYSGFYLFDEPESALSIERQIAFISFIDQLVKNGSQLVIATHSPFILAYPNAKIFAMTDNGPIQQQYKETQAYSLTKMFIDHPQRMLDELLD